MSIWDIPPLAPTLPNKQMLAAVGQTQLIRVWQDLFNLYGLHIGQMLLTRADLEEQGTLPQCP